MTENVLDKILTNTYQVHLPDVQLDVECRDIPFTFLVSALSRMVSDLREEMVESRAALAQAMTQMARQEGEGQDWNAMFSIATPALGRAIGSMPDMSSDMLKRVLVGSTVDHIDALTVNDAAFLLASSFERMDGDALGRSLKQIFTKATDAWATVNPKEIPEAKEVLPDTEQPQEEEL